MNDKQLIAKLQELRQIKPSQNWVVSLKKEIIGEERKVSVFEVFPRMIFGHKLAYATISVFAILIGLFGFAQSTLPGDFLFPIKKITEKSQGALLSGVDQSKYNLEIANKRLEDLSVIVKENKTGNLDSAIQEYKYSVDEVIRSLTENTANSSANFKEIAVRVRDIEQSKNRLETLGVVMVEESDQLNNALASLVQREIESLDKTTLSDEQQKTLVQIKEMYAKGGYSGALEMLLMMSGGN